VRFVGFVEQEGLVNHEWNNNDHINWRDQDSWQQTRTVGLLAQSSTGEVVGFYAPCHVHEGQEQTLSGEAAQAIAQSFFGRLLPVGETETQLVTLMPNDILGTAPEWVDQAQKEESQMLQAMSDQNHEAHFYFHRTYQGVPFTEGGYNIIVCLITGEVTGFQIENSPFPTDLSDGSLAVSAQVAKEEYLRNHPLQLVYIWPDWYGIKTPDPVLAYSSVLSEYDYNYYIDGLTGQTVRYKPANMWP
jgi:hypothetical protein